MIFLSNLSVNHSIPLNHPLHVSNFFNRSIRTHNTAAKQSLIISIAYAWQKLIKTSRSCAGFIEEEVFITTLRNYDLHAKHILMCFFDITQLGYNFGGALTSPTKIRPKRLNAVIESAIKDVSQNVSFIPEDIDCTATKSRVAVQVQNSSKIFHWLEDNDKQELIPAVNFLLQQDELEFGFTDSGKLKQRETSVGPIKNIELWPGELRKLLFGRSIDIENAFTQFLFKKLNNIFSSDTGLLERLFPELSALFLNKEQFRVDFCQNVLKLSPSEESIKKVKKIIMSIANGSTISPAIIQNGMEYSVSAQLIKQSNPELSIEELRYAAAYLQKLANQFNDAKNHICIADMKIAQTRKNKKKVFASYFEWERRIRREIWNLCGQTGLMLHDGIDGIISDLTDAEIIHEVEKLISTTVSIDH